VVRVAWTNATPYYVSACGEARPARKLGSFHPGFVGLAPQAPFLLLRGASREVRLPLPCDLPPRGRVVIEVPEPVLDALGGQDGLTLTPCFLGADGRDLPADPAEVRVELETSTIVANSLKTARPAQRALLPSPPLRGQRVGGEGAPLP
jgi:hypothetical protein